MGTVLTIPEIKRLLARDLATKDDQLVILDENFLLHDDAAFAGFMRSICDQTQQIIGPWRSEFRDCDKYTRFAAALAIAAHANTRTELKAPGLAVGILNYAKPDGGHSVLFGLTKPRGVNQIKLRVFEPQDGTEITSGLKALRGRVEKIIL